MKNFLFRFYNTIKPYTPTKLVYQPNQLYTLPLPEIVARLTSKKTKMVFGNFLYRYSGFAIHAPVKMIYVEAVWKNWFNRSQTRSYSKFNICLLLLLPNFQKKGWYKKIGELKFIRLVYIPVRSTLYHYPHYTYLLKITPQCWSCRNSQSRFVLSALLKNS